MIVCAVSSWLSSMIVIFPAESGSFSATCPITATWSPIWMMIGRRSSTTLPPSVWTNFVLSSSSLTSWRCVAVVVSTQSCWTRGRSSAASAARYAPERERPARTGANPFCAGGSRSAIAASTSTFSYSAVDRGVRNLRPDRVVLDHVSRDRLEPVIVERRVRDVERQHPDEREQDRHERSAREHQRRASGTARPAWTLLSLHCSLVPLHSFRTSAVTKRPSLARVSDACNEHT